MQAKYAARFIAYSKVKEAPGELLDVSWSLHIVSEVAQADGQDIIKRFQDEDEERLMTYLRVLAELALSSPEAFEERSSDLMDFVLKEVMFKASPSSEVSF